MRIDEYITKKGLVRSRSHAKDLIKRGKVSIDGTVVTKAGHAIKEASDPKILIDEDQYVSRGGLKLIYAVRRLNINFKDKVVLDIGASTGGFTQVALERGAQKVYAVDVGTEQLDSQLLKDERIIDCSPVNIKDFTPPEQIDFAVCDVSFLSTEYILPIIYKQCQCPLLFLFKPQFNGKSSKGIINIHDASRRVKKSALWIESQNQYTIEKIFPTKIKGKHGNQEFWMYLQPIKTKTD